MCRVLLCTCGSVGQRRRDSLVPYAIPVSLIAGNKTCFSSSVIPITARPQTPVTHWLFDPPTPAPTPTLLYCNNLGGVQTKTQDFEHHLLSLDIGYGLYKETWADRTLRHSIPRRYGFVTSRTQGTGTGFRILCSWALVEGPTTTHVAMDCSDWFAAMIETARYGALLLVSDHLRPHYKFSKNKSVLLAIRHLIDLLRPQATIMGGDFNCESWGDTSHLFYALCSKSLFHGFHLVHPPGTLTNWTVVDGVQCCTGVDHILTSPGIPPKTSHYPAVAQHSHGVDNDSSFKLPRHLALSLEALQMAPPPAAPSAAAVLPDRCTVGLAGSVPHPPKITLCVPCGTMRPQYAKEKTIHWCIVVRLG